MQAVIVSVLLVCLLFVPARYIDTRISQAAVAETDPAKKVGEVRGK